MCRRFKGTPFVIIGTDDRILVSDTTIYPYSAVVRVAVDFDGDGIFDTAGSGAMIGANDVLTAGHLLWNPQYGFAKNIMVMPAEAGAYEPFGSALGQTWTVPPEYVSSGGGIDYDIGVINLSTNIGLSTGWFGLQPVSAQTVTDSTVTLDSYPTDLTGGEYQYTSSDKVDAVIGNALLYNGALDMYFGSSGGPLWWQMNGGFYIVGVNTFQTVDGLYNGGTMLTNDFFNRVVAWSNDSPPNTIIAGTDGDDTLVGSSGPDIIRGLLGRDVISGGDGADLIYGNQGDDTIDNTPPGAAGNDTIYGGQGNDSIGAPGAIGNDVIYGNFHNDTIQGGDGNDSIYGGQGNDFIVENGGATNSDRLFGNLGADTFDFSTGSQPQSGQTQATADHISDFSDAQGDRVNIDAPLGGIHYVEAQGAGVTSVETAVSFASSQNLFGSGGAQGNVVFIAGATDGYLLVDANNTGSFGSLGDYAIVLDHLNSTTLFGPADLI
jgi:V8-like Glu-specific endopeptidase